MNNTVLNLIASAWFICALVGCHSEEAVFLPGPTVPLEPVTFTLFDEVVFYDGYAKAVDKPVPSNVVRLSNARYSMRLTEDQLASIQHTLEMKVTIGAQCDNYDRIGSVFLALVPKGAVTYNSADVERVEIARFITPFMDMNKQPDEVPYVFNINEVVPILKDKKLLAQNDIWIELDVFGVPYAANNEIAGCAGRNDTSRGSLQFHTTSEKEERHFNALIPLAATQKFNNYEDGASDAKGTTKKTIEFTLESDSSETQLVLITSNHGANAGGEEYIRRDHVVYVDEVEVLRYTPGRNTCEPFRMYNTQPNGIYRGFPKTDSAWQSFSNWCPGDVISTRIVELGAMSAGTHAFVIDVPDAVFAGGQGDFPFSLYVQARY